jgi:hypothetical protein
MVLATLALQYVVYDIWYIFKEREEISNSGI